MTGTCSAIDAAFLDYGLSNGQVLVPATYYVPSGRGGATYEPAPAYVRHIADAFRPAFVRRADLPVVTTRLREYHRWDGAVMSSGGSWFFGRPREHDVSGGRVLATPANPVRDVRIVRTVVVFHR